MKLIEFALKIKKIKKIKSFSQFRKRVLQLLSFFCRNNSYFLQGAMDIEPVSMWFNSEFVKKTGGKLPKKSSSLHALHDLEPWDNVRRDFLQLVCKRIFEAKLEGSIAELGVYKGYTARLLHGYLPNKKIYLFDTFEGFTKRSEQSEEQANGFLVDEQQFSDTNIDEVMKLVADKGSVSNIIPVQGYFPDSIETLKIDNNETFCLVHLDADLYQVTMDGLTYFYPRMTKGGYLIVHDYNAWLGAHDAVEKFASITGINFIPLSDKSGSAVFIKQ